MNQFRAAQPAPPAAALAPPRHTGRGTSPADGLALDLAAWDPLQAVASELRAAFAEPVRRAILQALAALEELSGQEVAVQDDLAVDAFWYALVEVVTREEEFPAGQRARLLQMLAAQVFHSERNPAVRNQGFFWVFLNDLAAKYLGGAGGGDDAVDLHAVLDQFLAYYRLDGPENADVVEGLERLVLPHLQRLRLRVREVVSLLAV